MLESAAAVSPMALPQHRELFLEPHYTVELSPQDEGEADDLAEFEVTPARHMPNLRRR
jgi:hypothetical protein